MDKKIWIFIGVAALIIIIVVFVSLSKKSKDAQAQLAQQQQYALLQQQAQQGGTGGKLATTITSVGGLLDSLGNLFGSGADRKQQRLDDKLAAAQVKCVGMYPTNLPAQSGCISMEMT